MIKKIICFIAVLSVLFSFSVLAKDEFFVYGEDDIEHISKALNMKEEEVTAYCKENMVTYLAVNSDNTKLIKRVETADDFSKRIVDLSVLSDKNIETLSYELSHFSDANGKIEKLNGFKLLKYELKTEDNKYYLTTYITVKNSKRITLSFYTDIDADRNYIYGVVKEQFKEDIDYKPFITVGIVIFALAGAVVVVLIIRDLRKEKE